MDWLRANKLSLNESKSKFVLFRSKKSRINTSNITIKLNHFKLEPVNFVKYLGTIIDETLSWNTHTDFVMKKLSQVNGIISKLRYFVPQKTLILIYYALFQSRLTYASEVWKFTSRTKLDKIFNLQKKCLRLITFSPNLSSSSLIFKSLRILKVDDLHTFQILKFMFDFTNGITPKSLSNMFQPSNLIHQYNTRFSDLYHLPSYNYVKYGKLSLRYQGALLWNEFFKKHSFLSAVKNHNKLKTFYKDIAFSS